VSFQSLGRRTGLHRHGGGRIGSSIVVTRSRRALVGFFMRGHCKIYRCNCRDCIDSLKSFYVCFCFVLEQAGVCA